MFCAPTLIFVYFPRFVTDETHHYISISLDIFASNLFKLFKFLSIFKNALDFILRWVQNVQFLTQQNTIKKKTAKDELSQCYHKRWGKIKL